MQPYNPPPPWRVSLLLGVSLAWAYLLSFLAVHVFGMALEPGTLSLLGVGIGSGFLTYMVKTGRGGFLRD